MASSAGFAAQDYAPSYDGGDSEESVGSSGDGGDGLAISDLGISPEIVKALSGRGIDKLFPIQVCSCLFNQINLKVSAFSLIFDVCWFV